MKDQIHILAVASLEKFPGQEDVLTFKEQGFDYDAGVSRGVALPAGAPDYALKKLEKVFMEITSSREYVQTMRSQGFVPRALTAEQFKAEISRQTSFWRNALKDADIKKK
jgi:tripartite-type tricarboxylate transporter receptor subunit TctC